MTGKTTKRMKRSSTHHATTKSHSKRAAHVVPPPRDEREPEPPRVTPGSMPPNDGELVTDYPDRSDWEAEVSEAAMERVRSGEHIKRNKGPNTEAS